VCRGASESTYLAEDMGGCQASLPGHVSTGLPYAEPEIASSSLSLNPFMSTCGVCTTPSVEKVILYPNFSGEWTCFACDGDMDAFLVDMGHALMARLSARLRRYDVGNIVRVLRQRGNDLDVDVRGQHKYTQMLTVGGGPQICEEEDGVVLVEPMWERWGKDGYVLSMDVSEQDGSKPRLVRQWLSRNELVIECTTRATACCVKWRYRKKSGSGAPGAKTALPAPDVPPPRLELMKNGKPNFAGTWNSYTCEGDMEGFFEEMGIGKAGRMAMGGMNYGVGLVEKIIVQTDEEFQISDAWPTGPTTQKFRVGAGEQVTVGTQGREIYVNPSWENDHILRVATQPLDRSETTNGPMRYYFEGDQLIVLFESVSGCRVKYLHRRKT